MEKAFKIGGQFYPAIIGQFYAAIDRVTEATIWINGEMHQEIANLSDKLAKIVRLLGPVCEKYYELER